jgi:hypothetical protein
VATVCETGAKQQVADAGLARGREALQVGPPPPSPRTTSRNRKLHLCAKPVAVKGPSVGTVISEYPSGAGEFSDLTRAPSLLSGENPELDHRCCHQRNAITATTKRHSANRIAVPVRACVRVYTGSSAA